VKSLIRRIVPEAFERFGYLGYLRSTISRQRAVVLRYHSVSELTEENSSYRCPTIAVSPSVFEAQMRYLARHYAVVPLAELIACQQAGEPFPKRAAAITFDDGYKDNFTHALPVLRELNLPSTVYVTTNSIGDGWQFWVSRVRALVHAFPGERLEIAGLGSYSTATPAERQVAIGQITSELCGQSPSRRSELLEHLAAAAQVTAPPESARAWMMSWDELRAMVAAGVDIGAHTLSHPILTTLSADSAAHEIAKSRATLEEGLESEVKHFAYPNGPNVSANHDDRVVAAVKAAGFDSASTSLNGSFSQSDDRYRLPRIPISDWARMSDFAFALERDRISGMGYRSRA